MRWILLCPFRLYPPGGCLGESERGAWSASGDFDSDDCQLRGLGERRFSRAAPMAISSSVVVFNCFVVDSWTLAFVALPGLDAVGVRVVS
jgi:hypothetical protein